MLYQGSAISTVHRYLTIVFQAVPHTEDVPLDCTYSLGTFSVLFTFPNQNVVFLTYHSPQARPNYAGHPIFKVPHQDGCRRSREISVSNQTTVFLRKLMETVRGQFRSQTPAVTTAQIGGTPAPACMLARKVLMLLLVLPYSYLLQMMQCACHANGKMGIWESIASIVSKPLTLIKHSNQKF